MKVGKIRNGLWLLLGAVIAPATLPAQGPLPSQEVRPPRPFVAWWEGPWWNGRAAQALSLSDAQKTEINGIAKDYRVRMRDLRDALEKADRDVEAAFSENPVDQKKANDAIEKLAAARGDLTRSLSQMSLKMRMVLTADQWQELRERSVLGRGERGIGRGRRGFEGRGTPPPPPSATKQ
jgi:Spy/CpxP family protein refolding chaperone